MIGGVERYLRRFGVISCAGSIGILTNTAGVRVWVSLDLYDRKQKKELQAAIERLQQYMVRHAKVFQAARGVQIRLQQKIDFDWGWSPDSPE